MTIPASPRDWVEFYKRRGYQPLPSESRMGEKKKPIIRFAEYWESLVPDNIWDTHPSKNIQVMTGRHWGLAVLDLDGPEAIDEVAKNWLRLPRTWSVVSGGGGRHLWFTVPRDFPPKAKSVLWAVWDKTANEGKGGWAKHKAVELLADRCLVIAPPSIHLKTGKTYQFEQGCSPKEIYEPAELPRWVWDMRPVVAPKPPTPEPVAFADRQPIRFAGNSQRISTREVIDAIHDKVSVAAAWGLRFASRNGSNGWIPCHDFEREDRSPYAQFNVDSGVYWSAHGTKHSFLSLGVALGQFADWQSAKDSLASEFCTTRKDDYVSIDTFASGACSRSYP